ncbi:MAG: hypothetical protein KAQ62_19760, partial [Cyclobacteriaceae bacterium]|nr:hypothetical protein [Cyclobacteriaceae bacterium]
TQVEAIKNIKIDKVTVWDSGSGSGGANSTSSFLSGLAKSLPPIEELLKNAGMELPSLLQGTKEVKAKSVEKKVTDTEEIVVSKKEAEKGNDKK